LPLERALIWSILGGYLLLPPVAAINLPMVPAMNKVSIPALTAFLICTLMLRHHVPVLPQSRLGQVLAVLFVMTPFGTALTNGEPQFLTVRVLPGLSLYDGISMAAAKVFLLLIWALARRFLATEAAIRELLGALVLAGLLYSLPMLIEVRMSPQVNVWVYGFFQHSFEQMVRWGGYRPIVFLEHGLWVAFFALMAFLSAVVLAREAAAGKRLRQGLIALYLGVVLVLCKTLGVLVYAAFLLPLILLAGPRLLLRVAALFALVVMAYPLLRAGGAVPVDLLVDLAARISEERAASLRYRFDNEAVLLNHALLRPWFGWGEHMRNLVHDPLTGETLTVSDGAWIIVMGTRGALGYVADFGLMVLPLILIALTSRHLDRTQLPLSLCVLASIHGVNLLDMLPNATITPITWLVTGALMGRAEALSRIASEARRRKAAMRHVPDGARPRTILR